MHADCTVFPAYAAPAGQDTNSSMTLFGKHSSELTFLLPRSLRDLFEGMESIQMASHWCHGKVGAASHGTLRSLIHWPSHTSIVSLDQLRLERSHAVCRCQLEPLFLMTSLGSKDLVQSAAVNQSYYFSSPVEVRKISCSLPKVPITSIDSLYHFRYLKLYMFTVS